MQVRVFGGVEIERDGRALDLGGAKRRAVLGLLVAARDRPVPPERLIEQVWPEGAPTRASLALQTHIAKLRRELEPDRDARAEPQLLVTRPAGYALLLADGSVDARRFEALLADDAGLDEALAVSAAPAYAGLDFCPALAAEARRLADLRATGLERWWSARVDRDVAGAQLGDLAALTAAHPTRERLWALLATAQARLGRQAEALETLRTLRAHLADELGLDPGPEVTALEQAVLRQEVRPVAAPPPTTTAAAIDAAPAGAAHQLSSLPGRGEALRRAAEVIDAATRGAGRLVLVTGEPGIGKSRLARAVADLARGAGLAVRWGGWEQEGSQALAGWTAAVPELVLPMEAAGDAASLLLGLADDVVAAARRSCLVLDDAQWADPDSLRLLGRVAGLAAHAGMVLVVTHRDPTPISPVLSATLARLARLAPVRLALGGLDADGVAELVASRSGVVLDAAGAERLRERTGGNPFLVHEVVRLGREGLPASGDSWRDVPAGVRDVVRQQLAELPPAAVAVLVPAAVGGRTVDLDVLEAVVDAAPGSLDDGLAAALAAGLLVDDAEGLRFPHALTRDAVYGDLPVSQRRRWHARVAAAIEQVHVGRLDDHAVALAEHYRAAGAEHARSAWTYARRAALQAARSGAHGDAVRLSELAVERQALDASAVTVEREQLDHELGVARRRAGLVGAAWEPLARAASSALERGDGVTAAETALSVTEHVLWSWRTQPVTDLDAVRLWQRLIDAVPADRPDLRARAQLALAVEAIHEPPGARFEGLVDEALGSARTLGDEAVLVEALQLASTVLRSPDLLARRLPVSDELVGLCARRGDERALALALVKRAANHSALGDAGSARADLDRALPLAQRHHLAPVLMVAGLGLATLDQAEGDFAASEARLAEAESVLATLLVPGNGIGLAQRAVARHVQGTLAGMADELGEQVDRYDIRRVLRELYALALVSGDRVGEARSYLGPWPEQPQLPFDYLWLTATAIRALVWARLGDGAAIDDLRVALAPYAGRPA
ncbi:MAG: BTAD domain-containing putative transcriptional regulator, partial [Jatrophihabitans sp.]|uniref:BTAD domain-containing putative transcriptional regulator n=1 Tax=Jatrophihabitans sp. TaxID=1932789 RepID=UPI003F8176C1